MPYYAVKSGSVFRCVLADDPTTACARAVIQHLDDETSDGCILGEIFCVAEFNKPEGESVLIASKYVAERINGVDWEKL